MSDELDRFIAEQQAAANPAEKTMVGVDAGGVWVSTMYDGRGTCVKVTPDEAEALAAQLIAAARKARNA
jgi:hypothetical protein